MIRHRAAGRAAIALAAAGVLALLTGACSSDDDASSPTTAASSTTFVRRSPGTPPTADELRAILPTGADVGEEWEQRPDGGTRDQRAVDPVVEAQCPALGVLLGDEAEAPDEEQDDDAGIVTRAFVDDVGRLISFQLDPDAPARSDAELEDAVDAMNACGPIVVEDAAVSDEDRATTTFRFQASIDPDHGEQAVKLQAEVATLLPGEDDPAVPTLYILVFRTGSVGVTISALDGLDLETLVVTRTDMELLTGLSDRLEVAVDDLVG